MKDYSDAAADAAPIHSHMEYGDEMPEQHPPDDAARAEATRRDEAGHAQHFAAHAPDARDGARRRPRPRLRQLTDWRAKPAVPFGGKFRIIDFTLSNCVNSGIRRIGICTQYKAQSLIRHVQRGWSVPRRALRRVRRAAAGAAAHHRGLVPRHRRRGVPEPRHPAPPRAAVRAGARRRSRLQDGLRHACSPTTSRSSADMTDRLHRGAARRRARSFGVMGVDADWRVTAFQEKPAQPAADARAARTARSRAWASTSSTRRFSTSS